MFIKCLSMADETLFIYVFYVVLCLFSSQAVLFVLFFNDNRMRNAYYRMINHVAAQSGCYPFMFLTNEEARELTEAQPEDTPIFGSHVFDIRDLGFLQADMNETDTRRTHPVGSLFQLFQQPTVVPGFNLTTADWNVEFMHPNSAEKPNLKQVLKMQPTPCRDWEFDDNDEEFEDYDYADDEENFARDDGDMARALATKPLCPDDIQGSNEEEEPTDAN